MSFNMTNGMQTSVSRFLPKSLPGMLAYDSRDKDNIFTYLLAAGVSALNFGLGVVMDALGGIRLPRQDVGVVTFAGAFVASNTINLKVNGVAMDQVTFASDSDTTLEAIATAIAGMDNVASAVADTDARTVTVTMDAGYTIAITDIVVAAGSSQTTGAASYASNDTYLGQPVYDPERVNGTGFLPYFDIAVARHTMGVWVTVSHDVAKGDAAYLDVQDATKLGQYTNVANGNIPTYGQFDSAALAGETAIVIINLPQG